ncbi:MAG: hypothetical protein ABJF88_01765 [Rhodothermales bacterium]
MYPTAEVRWFAEGPLPEAVEAWFHAAAGERPWEARTDRYVRPASPDGLGVKARSGYLEVKRLAEVVGEEELHDGVTGRVECWRKWSFPLGAGATLRDVTGDWVAVAKRRRKGTFAVRNGTVEIVQREEQAGQGCSLEIAEVEADGQTWWSVGFEAFGTYDQAALVEYLRRAAAHVFAAADPPALPAAQAMSYPAWLCALSKDGKQV